MKLKLLPVAAIFILSQSVASARTPDVCPSLAKIVVAGVKFAVDDPKHNRGYWMGVNLNNNFGTGDDWTFLAGPVTAKSESEALIAINAKLFSLNFTAGPRLATPFDNTYVCIYANNRHNFFGVTITPPYRYEAGVKYLNAAK